jgi:hypothetical protein
MQIKTIDQIKKYDDPSTLGLQVCANLKMEIVKVHGLISISKDTLRKEGTSWLIKCPGQVNLVDVWHFNTPLTCDNFGQTRVQHTGGKDPSLWLIKCLGQVNLIGVGHFNRNFQLNSTWPWSMLFASDDHHLTDEEMANRNQTKHSLKAIGGMCWILVLKYR